MNNVTRTSQRTSAISALLLLLLLFPSLRAPAQEPSRGPQTLPVVLLSDLHFDPFQDPGKAALLQRAPTAQWQRILASPASADQAQRFAAVQAQCNGKQGTDAPYALMRSALDAARAQARDATAVMVSGDLLVHDLDCRYRASLGLPADTTDDQSISSAFAIRTANFVMQQIQSAFRGVPVYFALGNNDSRCNHNRFDLHDPFFAATAQSAFASLPAQPAERTAALQMWNALGAYAATLPAAIPNTRLIVVNDTLMMPGFATCGGDTTDRSGEQQQIAWLRAELAAAQQRHQRVWLLGHLPPAVNVTASTAGSASVCSSGSVVAYQRSALLADTIAEYADTVRLGIFGHTHLDEFHLLRGPAGSVPIKVVGSITPVEGVVPSFTIAAVDPAGARLVNFTVYKLAGTQAPMRWSREYDFDSAYGVAGFDPASLTPLIDRLVADTTGEAPLTITLREHLRKGGTQKKNSVPWPAYACSLTNATAAGYKACLCRGR